MTEIDPTNENEIKDYRSNSLARLTLRRIFRQRSAIIGGTILIFLILVAIFAPAIAPYDPEDVLIGKEDIKKRDGPCIHLLGCDEEKPQHILGIDGNVRDQFSRIVYGTRYSLYIGFASVGFAIIAGTILGAIAGYAGGLSDNLVMRFMDVLLAFPSLLVAISPAAAPDCGVYSPSDLPGATTAPLKPAMASKTPTPTKVSRRRSRRLRR